MSNHSDEPFPSFGNVTDSFLDYGDSMKPSSQSGENKSSKKSHYQNRYEFGPMAEPVAAWEQEFFQAKGADKELSRGIGALVYVICSLVAILVASLVILGIVAVWQEILG